MEEKFEFPEEEDALSWTRNLQGPMQSHVGYWYYTLPRGTSIAHGTGRYVPGAEGWNPMTPDKVLARGNFYSDPPTCYSYCQYRSKGERER
jgi:hypothetical protein